MPGWNARGGPHVTEPALGRKGSLGPLPPGRRAPRLTRPGEANRSRCPCRGAVQPGADASPCPSRPSRPAWRPRAAAVPSLHLGAASHHHAYCPEHERFEDTRAVGLAQAAPPARAPAVAWRTARSARTRPAPAPTCCCARCSPGRACAPLPAATPGSSSRPPAREEDTLRSPRSCSRPSTRRRGGPPPPPAESDPTPARTPP
jgi:hypothetical protein